ncbi:MAG: hypothetical protein WD021_01590 [Rhodothermales bacterium]
MIDYDQPFIIRPNRVWRTYRGGAVLDRWSGRDRAADGPFPEDWVGSATRAVNPGREHLEEEGIGSACGADGKVYRMDELYTRDPRRALGADHVAAYGARPYLLVKLLDAAMRLHIQAHPSASWAKSHLDADSGKTEAWWILHTRSEQASVFLGFQEPPTPAEWLQMVESQDVDAIRSCFEPITVREGDVLLVEGGVPHAIGEGIAMIEVQEPTDYVVRCEYAHGETELPESARTMGLGMEQVLDMFDYSTYPSDSVKERFGPRPVTVARTPGGREVNLLARPQTDRLELRRVDVDGRFTLPRDGRFSILIAIEGSGSLRAGGVDVPVSRWSRFFLPASLEHVELTGNATFARCMPPKP